MKRIISILLLLIFACTMVTSCSKLGSRQYVLDVLDAMDKGDDERFYKLLEDKSYDINRNPNLFIDRFIFWGMSISSPIEKACSLSRYDYVEALIKRGADINRRYNLGALYTSVKFMKTDIVKLLLENGADPSIGASYPLIAVARRWNFNSVESYKIMKLLIEYGADKSFKDRQFGYRNAYEVALYFEAPQEFLDLLNPDK